MAPLPLSSRAGGPYCRLSREKKLDSAFLIALMAMESANR